MSIDPRVTELLTGFGVDAPTPEDIAWACDQLGIAAPAEAAEAKRKATRRAQAHDRAMNRGTRRIDRTRRDREIREAGSGQW